MTQATFALVPDGTTQFFNLPFTAQSVEINNQSQSIVNLYRNDSIGTIEAQIGALTDVVQNITNGVQYKASSVIPSNGPVTLTFSDQIAQPTGTSGPSSVQQQVIPLTIVTNRFSFKRLQTKFAQFFIATAVGNIPGIAGHNIYVGSNELGVNDFLADMINNAMTLGPFAFSLGQGAIITPSTTSGWTHYNTYLPEDVQIISAVPGDTFGVAVFATA